MNSVAFLGDIHGLEPVLRQVLATPTIRDADLIVVLGDTISGPMPAETITALAELGKRCVCLKGNADQEVLDALAGAVVPYPESTWAATQLTPEQVDFVAAMPHPYTFTLTGYGDVVCCHGSPRDMHEVLLVDSPVQQWLEILAAAPAAVRAVACAHTHMPYMRLVGGRTIINPGSVGMPYGYSAGSWAVLRATGVQLGFTPIDVDAMCAEVLRRSTFPDVGQWLDLYWRQGVGDVEALRTFSA